MELPPSQPFLEVLQEKLVLAENIGFPADQLQETYAVVSRFKQNIEEVSLYPSFFWGFMFYPDSFHFILFHFSVSYFIFLYLFHSLSCFSFLCSCFIFFVCFILYFVSFFLHPISFFFIVFHCFSHVWFFHSLSFFLTCFSL